LREQQRYAGSDGSDDPAKHAWRPLIYGLPRLSLLKVEQLRS
jgi:hypothetical protein